MNEWEPSIEQALIDHIADKQRKQKEHREFTLHFWGEAGKKLECDVEATGSEGVRVAPGDQVPVIELRAFTRMEDSVGYLLGVMHAWVNGDTSISMTEAEAEVWKRKRGIK